MSSIENEIKNNGYYVFTVKGNSMLPSIRPGRDLVLIEAHKERYKHNDIVLFKRNNGQYVLHRVIKVLKDEYIIVGDNSYDYEYVSDNQILGILTSIKRNNKTVIVKNLYYRVFVFLWCNPIGGRRIVLTTRLLTSKLKRGIKHFVHRDIQNSWCNNRN